MKVKIRNKVTEKEAVQWTGDNLDEVIAFTKSPETGNDLLENYIEIKILGGIMRADVNDWIIKGLKGEFYPCKPDIFEQSYEIVE